MEQSKIIIVKVIENGQGKKWYVIINLFERFLIFGNFQSFGIIVVLRLFFNMEKK